MFQSGVRWRIVHQRDKRLWTSQSFFMLHIVKLVTSKVLPLLHRKSIQRNYRREKRRCNQSWKLLVKPAGNNSFHTDIVSAQFPYGVPRSCSPALNDTVYLNSIFATLFKTTGNNQVNLKEQDISELPFASVSERVFVC